MDSELLMKRLQSFVQLGQREGKPVEILALEDAMPGLTNDAYIVHVLAPWAVGMSFNQQMDELLDLLWRSTTPEEREGISMLRVSSSQVETAGYVPGGMVY